MENLGFLPLLSKGETMKIQMVDPKLLVLDEDQPRESLDADHVSDLAFSMKTDGYDQECPVVVRKMPDGTLIVKNGAHRTTSAVQIGLPEIPCIISEVTDKDLTDKEIAKMRLEQARSNMVLNHKPMELINVAEKAIQEGIRIQIVAAKIGKSVKAIQDDRVLFQAPGAIKKVLNSGDISKQTARHITEKFMSDELKNVKKTLQKALKGGRTSKAQCAAVDAYADEVAASLAGRKENQDMFDTEQTKGVKTDKNLVCVHDGKNFTLKNVETYFNYMEKSVNKYLSSPLGNGHANALLEKIDLIKAEQMVKSLTATAMKMSEEIVKYKAVANA